MGWKQELGEQIKRARKSAGMTQGELASVLQVSRQMVSRYEAGRDSPAIEVLAMAAQALDTEFQVRGVRITSEQVNARLKPRPVDKQLQLDFEKPRRFHHAMIEITPRKGRILIKAEIPA